MNRRFFAIILGILAVCCLFQTTGGAQDCSIQMTKGSKVVKVCGKNYVALIAPSDVDGVVYAPLSFFAERFGLDTEWNWREKSVVAKGFGIDAKLWIGKTQAQKDGRPITLPSAPVVIKDRCFLSPITLNALLDLTLHSDRNTISGDVDGSRIKYRWTDFNLPKDRGEQNETVRLTNVLSDSKTRVVVVQIWYTACAPCRDELKYLGQLYKDFSDKGLVVIGVCTDGPGFEGDRWQLLEELGVTFPIALDEQYSLKATWFNPVFPNFFLLRPDEPYMIMFNEGFSQEANDRLREIVSSLCNTH